MKNPFHRSFGLGLVILGTCLFCVVASSQNTPPVSGSPTPNSSASPTQNPSASSTLSLKTATGSIGEYLTDGQGKSLYVFMKDSNGASSCYDACAQTWPPYYAPNNQYPSAQGTVQTSYVSTYQRSDGQWQATYKGQPLYYYSADQYANSTSGQGVNSYGGYWYLVKPDGTPYQ